MTIQVVAKRLMTRPPEDVFDFITSPDAVGKTFDGHGLIPGAERSEVIGEHPLREGSTRRVHSTDGATIDEEILSLERPHTQTYRLVSGLKPPFSWLVKDAGGHWQLRPEGSGTHVTWTFSFTPRSWLTLPLIILFIKRPFRRAMEGCLSNTRRLLEEIP